MRLTNYEARLPSTDVGAMQFEYMRKFEILDTILSWYLNKKFIIKIIYM